MKTEISNNPTDTHKRDVHEDEAPIVVSAVQARQGFRGKPVLIVLIVSLALAIGIGVLMLIKN